MNIKDCVFTLFDKYVTKKRRNIENAAIFTKQDRVWGNTELTSEQREKIDSLFEKNYGEKIPHHWHRYYMTSNKQFDVNYFPDLIYMAEFQYYMNLWQEYVKAIEDKNLLPLFAKAAGVKTAKTYVCATKGVYRDENFAFISREEAENKLKNIGKVFIKPTIETNSGKGCFVAELENGIDKLSNKTAAQIITELGNEFAVQECVQCCEDIKKIYDKSVNTFRIITYRWKDEICFTPAAMRIGRGGNVVDNGHSGGIFVSIDREGRLGKTAYTEWGEVHTEHPDSHVVFDGYKIGNVEAVFEAAQKMHEALPQLGLIGWDFTLDSTGSPLLIEANATSGGIKLSQIGNGKGLFGDKTAEILRWIKKMKSTPLGERKKFAFGKI